MGYYLGVTLKFLERFMLMLIYDIVWWAIFLLTGVIAIMYFISAFTPQVEKGLDGTEFFFGINTIVFVMMFLSIDKQSLI